MNLVTPCEVSSDLHFWRGGGEAAGMSPNIFSVASGEGLKNSVFFVLGAYEGSGISLSYLIC